MNRRSATPSNERIKQQSLQAMARKVPLGAIRESVAPRADVTAQAAPRRRIRLAWGVGLLLLIAVSFAAWRLVPTAERPQSIDSLAVLPFLNGPRRA